MRVECVPLIKVEIRPASMEQLRRFYIYLKSTTEIIYTHYIYIYIPLYFITLF